MAEKLSGKHAAITAEQVLADAVELAKLRGYSTELSAVAMIVTDKAAQQELAGMAKAAASAEAEAREASAKGEASREIVGTLQVVNHTNECLNVYVDGRYVGEVHEGHTASFHVHAHNWHNHFDAYCQEGGELVRHGGYTGHAHFLTWHIHGSTPQVVN